jgi:hypothetical protein
MNNKQVGSITQKIFKNLVNFVYEELLNQFLNNNGDCEESTFRLVNWSIILDRKRTEGIL